MIKLLLLTATVTLVTADAENVQYTLPDYLKICYRDDPDFNGCFLDAVKYDIPFLADGVKEWNLPKLDPYYVDELKVSYKNPELAVDVRVLLNDVQISGGKSAIPTNMDVDPMHPQHPSGELSYLIPRLLVEGHYKIMGKFLGSPIHGKGFFNVTTDNLSINVKFNSTKFEKDSWSFLHLDKIEIDPDVENMRFYVSNIMAGKQDLSIPFSNMINQFAPIMFDEMKVHMRDFYNDVYKDWANDFMMKLPFDVVAPLTPSSAPTQQ